MFDPRTEIRDVLRAYKPAGQEESGIIFHDTRGSEYEVDVNLWEEQLTPFEEGGKLGLSNPQMILLSTISSVSKNANIGATKRSRVALIDAHIFIVKDDRWEVEAAKKEVSNNLEAAIIASQKTIPGCDFVEAINGRDLDALKQTLGIRRIVGIRAYGSYE